MLGGTQDRPAQRVLAERRPVDQVLGDHRRLVVRARDLLDHDAALAVEFLGVDLRTPDEVGQQIDRLGGDLGAARDVEGDEIVRRVRVEHRAHRLGGLIDLAVVVVLLAALEDEMLQEMGHTVLFGAVRSALRRRRPRARWWSGWGAPRCTGEGRSAGRKTRCAPWPLSLLDAPLQGTLRAPRTRPRTLGERSWQQPNDIFAVVAIATTRTGPARRTRRRRAPSSPSTTSRSAIAPPTSRSTASRSTSTRASSSSWSASPAPASRRRCGC